MISTAEAESFGLVAGIAQAPHNEELTVLGNRRTPHEELEESQLRARFLNDSGARVTGITFVPADELPFGSDWNAPETTHGVVDGHTAVPRDWIE